MNKVITSAAGRAAHLARQDVTISTAAEKLLDTKERARKAAAALNGDKVDTTTPLFETAPAPPKPIIVLSTTVAYRGRIVTITNEGMTLDQFCDLLDKKFGVAE